MSRILFFISEALRALRRSAAPSIAAIVTVVVTTLLLGVLVPVLRASESKTEDVREQIGLEVFLFDDATKAEIEELRSEIVAIPNVEGVEFVSKKEALQELRREEKDSAIVGSFNELQREDIPESLQGNPLPRSFDVSLDDASNLEAVTAALEPPNKAGEPKPISPIIDQVSENRAFASELRSVTDAVKIVLGVIAVLLLVASLMLIANTIRLSIYARRREVEVMRLVGATNWFIRWPFMIEGVLVGLLGAAIAVGILWLGKVTIVDPLADNFALVDNFSTVGFLPLVLVLIASAIVVSALGSGITLRRFLRI
jgi:cell division transport system permease protein